ncbi:tetracycline resistance protein [Heyndrickxia sporothermodurans]|nr:tetracycline resistance protein [Heyndrickxia sporothermodurans]
MNYKTIGILAHVDAGKTTFSEQVLFHTKSIAQRGRVDHQTAFMDAHNIEKERGITIFADQAHFFYNQSHYFLIDTPGHVDFSAEMERSIQVMDYAIVIISAVEGIEGHTETVWQLLRKYRVPTFFFINKIDREGADLHKVIQEIRTQLTTDVCSIDEAFENNCFSGDLIEFIAEKNDLLLEKYLSDQFDHELWLKSFQNLIMENRICPLASGSALLDDGILSFLSKLDQLTISNYHVSDSFSGRVFKIRHDHNGTKIVFIKALSGKLKVRDEINYGDSENIVSEKITQIRKYNGNKYEVVNQVVAGEIFAVTGLSKISIGEAIGALHEKSSFEMVATLKSKVYFDPSLNSREVLSCFQILDDEDPSLSVMWDENLQEIHLHVMGSIQLEVLKQLVMERFHFEVTFEKPEVLYKESISTTVKGYGHFEPLKHYAEVHLKLEPSNSLSDLSFISEAHPDDLPTSYQNLVKHYLFEKEHRGILTGSPLTNLKITLITGRAHIKHTSGGDFREATIRALRQALEKANNILLEPYYDFKITIELNQMGRVLSDVQAAHGSYDPPVMNGNRAIIIGRVPVSTFLDYSTILASFSHGKGGISLRFGGYDQCHNETEVIQRIGYNKDADPEYSSSSIFCSKGQGYSVHWDQAESMMHCLKG